MIATYPLEKGGVVDQQHLRGNVCDLLKCAPTRTSRDILLLYCSATSAFRATHSSTLLGEWVPPHGEASNAIAAPPLCVTYPLPLLFPDMSNRNDRPVHQPSFSFEIVRGQCILMIRRGHRWRELHFLDIEIDERLRCIVH